MGLQYHIYTYTSQLDIVKFIRWQNYKIGKPFFLQKYILSIMTKIRLFKIWLYNPFLSITIKAVFFQT